MSDDNRGCRNHLPRETHQTSQYRVQGQRDWRGASDRHNSPRAHELMSARYREPEDESYKKLHGLHAVVPIVEREVKIRQQHGAKREKGRGEGVSDIEME